MCRNGGKEGLIRLVGVRRHIARWLRLVHLDVVFEIAEADSAKLPQFSVDRIGKLRILHVMGEVEAANVFRLEGAIRDAVATYDGLLLASFLECSHVDRSYANALILQHERSPAHLLIVDSRARRGATRFRHLGR